jgi:hypothetical protein
LLLLLQRSRAALTALGIPNDPTATHHTHYHIDFNAPARLSIQSNQNLMVDGANVTGMPLGTSLDSSILCELALDLAWEWGLSENDMDAYLPVDLESTKVPMVIVAAADKITENVIGVCQPVDNAGGFDLRVAAQTHFFLRGVEPMEVDISRIEIKVIYIVRQPEHGHFILGENSLYGEGTYIPDEGYLGEDRLEAFVAVGDDVVRVVYNFVVQPNATDQLEESAWNALCPKGLFWIISETSTENQPPATLQSLFSFIDTGTFSSVRFSDLSGAALAQTTGTGASAQITLDTDAAGHGWFIDYTPYLKEGYLPTSAVGWVETKWKPSVGR